MDLHELLELESELRKVAHKITTEWKCRLGSKFSRTEVLVLYHLMTDGKQRASALASALSITTGGLTGITDKLVKGGYIHRNRDTADRRVVYLTISDKGKEELYSLREARETFVQQVFKGFSKDEVVHLTEVSKKLFENLTEMEQASAKTD